MLQFKYTFKITTIFNIHLIPDFFTWPFILYQRTHSPLTAKAGL